jgi:hypothetical protein
MASKTDEAAKAADKAVRYAKRRNKERRAQREQEAREARIEAHQEKKAAEKELADRRAMAEEMKMDPNAAETGVFLKGERAKAPPSERLPADTEPHYVYKSNFDDKELIPVKYQHAKENSLKKFLAREADDTKKYPDGMSEQDIIDAKNRFEDTIWPREYERLKNYGRKNQAYNRGAPTRKTYHNTATGEGRPTRRRNREDPQ